MFFRNSIQDHRLSDPKQQIRALQEWFDLSNKLKVDEDIYTSLVHLRHHVNRDGHLTFSNQRYSLSLAAIKYIFQQRVLKIYWEKTRLFGLLSVGFAWESSVEPMDKILVFWTTSSAQAIERYLESKLRLARLFLSSIDLRVKCPTDDLDIFFTDRWKISRLVRGVAESVSNVLAFFFLFPYHTRAEPAWLRHRNRKLVLLRQYLADAFVLLLTSESTRSDLDSPDATLNIFLQIMEYGPRITYAWLQALKTTDDLKALKNHVGVRVPDHTSTSQDSPGSGSDGPRFSHWRYLDSSALDEIMTLEFDEDTAIDDEHVNQRNHQILEPCPGEACLSRQYYEGYAFVHHPDYDCQYWSQYYDTGFRYSHVVSYRWRDFLRPDHPMSSCMTDSEEDTETCPSEPELDSEPTMLGKAASLAGIVLTSIV